MDINITDIINSYSKGESLSSIANRYGTYGAKIKQILTNNGIRTRTHAEQNRISNENRAKKVDDSYFDIIDSPQKAWLLGFLASDGNVSQDRNRIKIGLSSVDREILEKIRNEIKCQREIFDYESNQGFSICELAWSSENQKCQLAKYDIIPSKTYHPIHLPNFSNEYKMAYFLGFYDGDGCFSFNKTEPKQCSIKICSYRPEILEDFVKYIEENFSFTVNVIKDKQRQNYYYLTYSTRATAYLLDYIYSYMINNNCFFLQRKYDKYCNWKYINNRI